MFDSNEWFHCDAFTLISERDGLMFSGNIYKFRKIKTDFKTVLMRAALKADNNIQNHKKIRFDVIYRAYEYSRNKKNQTNN